jgi:hypothetical protein
MNPQLTVLSFGGGQDSTALLYLYAFREGFREKYAPGDFLVLMSDTGDEHPETYQHVRATQAFCKSHGIEFAFLYAGDDYHEQTWPDLRSFYRRTNTVGSKAFPKTCTDKLKIGPIYRFLNGWVARKYGLPETGGRWRGKLGLVSYAHQYGKIHMLIGIAKTEEQRIKAATDGLPVWMNYSIQRRYPLVDLGMDRAACQRFITALGKPVPPPSNCMLCPYMSEIELLWLYRFHPADYHQWVEIEQAKLAANQHQGVKNLGVWGTKTLPMVMQQAQTKYGHMTDAELQDYKMSHGHCVKSKY